MTEQEWLASESIDVLCCLIGWRKRCLATVACCRQILDLLEDARSKDLVEALEWFADGLIDRHRFDIYLDCAYSACGSRIRHYQIAGWAVWRAAIIATTSGNMSDSFYNICNVYANSGHDSVTSSFNDLWAKQVNLLRNLANPYYKPTYNPSTQARNLANVIYKNKDWQALTILADMLEEEGCIDTKLLNHLRMKEEVYRGWWSLDVIRGF